MLHRAHHSARAAKPSSSHPRSPSSSPCTATLVGRARNRRRGTRRRDQLHRLANAREEEEGVFAGVKKHHAGDEEEGVSAGVKKHHAREEEEGVSAGVMKHHAGDEVHEPYLETGAAKPCYAYTPRGCDSNGQYMNNTTQINSSADVPLLEPRQDLSLHVSIVSLGRLREVPNCYRVLRRVIPSRNWACPNLKIVVQFYGLVTRLDDIRVHLNTATDGKATVEGLVPTLVSLQTAGVQLQLTEAFIPSLKNTDPLLKSTIKLGEMLYATARDVARGSETLADFQAGVPGIIEMIEFVLNAQMSFP